MRITAAISNGLVNRAPKRVTLGVLRSELQKFENYVKLSDSEKHALWNRSLGLYDKISKKSFLLLRSAKNADKTYDKVLEERKSIVYEAFRKEFKRLEADKNELADAIEYRAKRDRFRETVSSGIFYLCSSHIKPAQDHAEWEGKIYVKENWKDLILEDTNRARIEAYIRNHDIKTVEWVTGEPVYLIFRPNCKHFLKEVPVEEVLTSSVRSMLKKYGMYHRDLPEMSYEYREYKLYYERLKVMKYLDSMFTCSGLRMDIQKTRNLALKWFDKARHR